MLSLKERIKIIEERKGTRETETCLISVILMPYPKIIKNGEGCLSYKRQHSSFIKKTKNEKEKKEWNCGVFHLSCIGCLEKCAFALRKDIRYEDATRIIKDKEAKLNKVQTSFF